MFFALWPTHAQQAFLAETARDVVLAAGGRPVPPENFHVTLAFLGSVPQARIPQVEAIAREVASEVAGTPVELTFDAIEYWKRPKLICATGRTAANAGIASGAAPGASASAGALAGALESHLTPAGLMPDLKSSSSVGGRPIEEFRPHVTLARKLAHPIHRMGIQPVLWTFTDFALVDSRTERNGSVYTVLQTFPLGVRKGSNP